MNLSRVHGPAFAAAAILALSAACSLSSTAAPSVDWSRMTSAVAGGGMAALVSAARAEGALSVIGLPSDRANYARIISTFESTYGIHVTSLKPGAGDQEEVDALDGTSRAPDIVDVGLTAAVDNVGRFARYEVKEWDDIPPGGKDSSGAWYDGYGGYMAIGYDSGRVPAITSVQDLLDTAFRSKVALAGDPMRSNQGLNGVIMAAVVNGGSLDDVSKGVGFFRQLKQAGNFVSMIGTDATVASGQTPVLIEWDYLSTAHRAHVPAWKVFVPGNVLIGGYAIQAVNKQAPHPAAARLWEEFVYSDQGQNLWLQGGVHPVRQAAMTTAQTIDTAAAAALPQVIGSPEIATADQTAKASAYVQANWSRAVG